MKPPILLTEQQKNEMVKMYAVGASTAECARIFDIDPSTVLKWVKASGVTIRPMKIAKKQYNCDETVFRQSTAESLYWLGFLLADGCIVERESASLILAVALSEVDASHLEALKQFLNSNTPLSHNRKQKSVGLRVSSDLLCQDLIKRGCTPRKSLTLTFPPSGYFYRRHFIRGYFDGDGSIYVNEKVYCMPTVSIVGTYNFLEKLQEILVAEAGININAIRSHKHSEAFYLSYTGRGNAKKIYDYLYGESGTCLYRKKAKFEYALSYQDRKSVTTTGGVTIEMMKKYIESQKGK